MLLTNNDINNNNNVLKHKTVKTNNKIRRLGVKSIIKEK